MPRQGSGRGRAISILRWHLARALQRTVDIRSLMVAAETEADAVAPHVGDDASGEQRAVERVGGGVSNVRK